MRVLEARFHPQQKKVDDFLVVAHLVWQGQRASERPVVRPSPSLLLESAPATILSKLQYLVSVTAPGSFERLQSLRSRFWSFIEVLPQPASLKGEP
jgi:hypothetical protein